MNNLGKVVAVYFSNDLLNEIEQRRAMVSRSRYLRYLIQLGLEADGGNQVRKVAKELKTG
jgi:hypothetical protein